MEGGLSEQRERELIRTEIARLRTQRDKLIVALSAAESREQDAIGALARLRAQLAKADAAAKPVTISEAEIERFLESGLISAIRRDGWNSGDAKALIAWLRRHRIEVTP